jgi:hypothetical protein
MISGFKVFFTVGERSLYYEKKVKTVMIKYSTNIKKTNIAWNRHNIVVVLNRLMGSQPAPLDNLTSNGNTYINKR